MHYRAAETTRLKVWCVKTGVGKHLLRRAILKTIWLLGATYITFVYCCDQKARAAYAQSFALWQQATIEFTCHDHSIFACSCHIYVLLFFAHISFVVNHTFNVTLL